MKTKTNSYRYIHKQTGKRSYMMVRCDNHPRSDYRGYTFEHILVAEKALGDYLPANTAVHHIDNNGLNNINSNLVICQDDVYHKSIHKKLRRL